MIFFQVFKNVKSTGDTEISTSSMILSWFKLRKLLKKEKKKRKCKAKTEMLHSSLSSHNLMMMIILILQLVSFNVQQLRSLLLPYQFLVWLYGLVHPADHNQYFLVKFFADFVDKLI